MLHRIINWLGYKLHIKKRKEGDAFEALIDLLPLMVAMSIAVGMIKLLWKDLPPLPWYKRLWYWLKFKTHVARATLIGY